MRAIDVRILVMDDGTISVSALGESGVMPKQATCKEVYERYIKWGATQGGRNGLPWDELHTKIVALRLRWWMEQTQAWEKSIDQLTPHVFEAAIPNIPGRCGNAPSSKTRQEYIGVAKAFIAWALARDLCSKDPMRVVRLPSAEVETDSRALTVDEYQRILAVAPPLRRLFYETSALIGLRRGELCDLRPDNIDAAHGCVRLDADQTKARKRVRELPAPQDLLERLEALGKQALAHGQEKIFFEVDVERVTKDFHKDRKLANVERETSEGKVSLTSLRKLRATALQEAGVGLVEAQKLMRHSDPSITARHYTTVTNAAMRKSVEALSATLMPKEVVPAVGIEPKSTSNRFIITAQHHADEGVVINSCKIEQLARLTSVWFSLDPEIRGKMMELAGFDWPVIAPETRA